MAPPTTSMEMEGDNKFHLLPSQFLTNRSRISNKLNYTVPGVVVEQDSADKGDATIASNCGGGGSGGVMKKNYNYNCNCNYEEAAGGFSWGNASFMRWKAMDVLRLIKCHPIPCFFAATLLFFMGVEYTLRMVPSSSPPFDLGFVLTLPLHRFLASSPNLNTFLAGLNTVFVGMQTAYILWTWLIEGRPRATISALFMFTCRGILGYLTQLPLPEDFLGSGVDFPVGNVSFFLFYSGHVAASIIASIDMKRMQRWELSWTFDTLNALQVVRLLSTRGHYTIDLVVGVGAGILFDSLAGNYLDYKTRREVATTTITINDVDVDVAATYLKLNK